MREVISLQVTKAVPSSARLVAFLFIVIHVSNSFAADIVQPERLFEQYCLACHEGVHAEANFDLSLRLKNNDAYRELIFENIATEKMPPANAELPSANERLAMLKWLADQSPKSAPETFRRLSRYEFVHSLNDLLGTNLDLADQIPDDRGTYNFDTDRRIQLSKEILGSYFAVADTMLDTAFPQQGFPDEQIWVTNQLKDCNEDYKQYVRNHDEGTLFSWTRANNGNSYSFFFDNFDPPVAGWYELTFEAAKIGDFEDDVTIQVHAGRYYFADDRPQPQRLLEAISLGDRELQTYTIRAFLNPGESVSVHCYSKHNWRQSNPSEGAYIRQLHVRGPVQDQWPPRSFVEIFQNLPIVAPPRPISNINAQQANLQRIDGSIEVSSFQPGMEKEQLLDGQHRTFWHTRFAPELAEPPHYVIIENPHNAEIVGLTYGAWSGGNGNGQVKKYSIYLSEDGLNWGDAIVSGELEILTTTDQPIDFPAATTKRFIKFLITDSMTLDGRSLASVGKLDVVLQFNQKLTRTKISVTTGSPDHLKEVLRRFAERAFSTQLTDAELAPYIEPAQRSFVEDGDFVRATKVGLKAVICSPRFLMVPGEHSSGAYSQTASLARTLWLSVPDRELNVIASNAGSTAISHELLRTQVHRMLADERSDRMIESFCDQWLNLRSWNKVTPSLKLYPKYDDLLHYYLPLETQQYLSYLIRENMPVAHLVDSDYSFLNQRLAEHYGIDGIMGQELRKVALDAKSPRGGLLTMGSVLKVTTDGFQTSPILRGAWISKNLLGIPLSPPPESVKAIEAEHDTSALSLRQQIEAHKENATCNACHKSIDPYGFALESFDASGQWRETYRVEIPHEGTFQFRLEGYFHEGAKVDSAGEINDERFEDIFGLKQLLLSSYRCVGYNFAKKFFEFTTGYAPNLAQRMDLLAMLADTSDRCRLRDLVTEVLVYALAEQAQ